MHRMMFACSASHTPSFKAAAPVSGLQTKSDSGPFVEHVRNCSISCIQTGRLKESKQPSAHRASAPHLSGAVFSQSTEQACLRAAAIVLRNVSFAEGDAAGFGVITGCVP